MNDPYDIHLSYARRRHRMTREELHDSAENLRAKAARLAAEDDPGWDRIAFLQRAALIDATLALSK